MSSKADLLGEVKRLTGRDLHSEQWTIPELKELQMRAKTCKPQETGIVVVPLAPWKSHLDPRLSSREYLKLIFFGPNREERIRQLGLRIEKPRVVLALEGTLIDIIDETPNSPRQTMLMHDSVISNSEKRVNIDIPELSKTVLVAVRKHSGRFLQSLKSFSQLFLVSSLPHKVVRRVVELLQWTDYFDDIVTNAETRSIEEQFPQLAGSQSVSILEDRLALWRAEDWKYIIPSKTYLPLRRAAMYVQALTYELGGLIKHVEALRSGYCLFEVEPNSAQLLRVEEKLREGAFDAFVNQYQQRHKKPTVKAYVEIPDLQKRRIAEQIAKLLGWQLQDLRSLADVVVGDQSVPDTPAYHGLTFMTLVQTFFNVDRRS